jgi:3-oxoacyl-[acyl-carrier-protein] synthase-1
VEALIAIFAIRESFVPATLNCTTVDPAIRGNVEIAGRAATVRYALTNSFGFGGSNCALVFGSVR